MKIGLFIVCTGKYHVFIDQLFTSISKYFMVDHLIDIILITDRPNDDFKTYDRILITTVPVQHKPFPYPTLYRYKYFLEAYQYMLVNEIKTDYLFYCDVDMRFENNVGNEILSDITAVVHPGFFKGGWGDNNNNEKSMSFLNREHRKVYYAGGFQGGKTVVYMEACKSLAENIDKDEKNGIIAGWHDESHWNHFLNYELRYKEKYKGMRLLKLPPSYCYPESWKIPFSKKLIALDKNHKEIRDI